MYNRDILPVIRIVVFCLIAFLVTNCSCQKNIVDIEQVESQAPVIVRRHKALGRIKIPLSYRISKRSIKEIRITHPSYLTWREEIFCNAGPISKEENGRLISIYDNDNDKTRFLRRQPRQYSFYLNLGNNIGNIDTLAETQKLLAPYVKQMQQENKDSLNIGTIRELRITNPKLLEKLTKGDSIVFDFYYDKLYHPIILPVEIK